MLKIDSTLPSYNAGSSSASDDDAALLPGLEHRMSMAVESDFQLAKHHFVDLGRRISRSSSLEGMLEKLDDCSASADELGAIETLEQQLRIWKTTYPYFPVNWTTLSLVTLDIIFLLVAILPSVFLSKVDNPALDCWKTFSGQRSHDGEGCFTPAQRAACPESICQHSNAYSAAREWNMYSDDGPFVGSFTSGFFSGVAFLISSGCTISVVVRKRIARNSMSRELLSSLPQARERLQAAHELLQKLDDSQQNPADHAAKTAARDALETVLDSCKIEDTELKAKLRNDFNEALNGTGETQTFLTNLVESVLTPSLKKYNDLREGEEFAQFDTHRHLPAQV